MHNSIQNITKCRAELKYCNTIFEDFFILKYYIGKCPIGHTSKHRGKPHKTMLE